MKYLLLSGCLLAASLLQTVIPAQAENKLTTEQATSIDVEAGPIWNNEHAKQRCPEVLAEWLARHPGQKAEWTGHWMTTIENTMSVCNLRIFGTSGK